MEVLVSREFQRRVENAWTAFVDRGDDRLVQFAHQRLFGRDASSDEVELLKEVADKYGYRGFVAALLHGSEYEERYGHGLPAEGDATADAAALVLQPTHARSPSLRRHRTTAATQLGRLRR
jgi:Phycobilisome Linker polypeptide